MIMEKHDVTWIFTYLKYFPKYFYIVETSVIFLQYNSNRFIYYLEMKIYNLSILCSLDFIMVFCLLSQTYVCIYAFQSTCVCLFTICGFCVCVYICLYMYVFINTCARIREICFVYVYFLLAREFNPFEINFSFKIINIIKWKQ